MEKKTSSVASFLPPWYRQKLFKFLVFLLLALSSILLLYQVSYVLAPVFNFISILFAPIFISFLFYYFLRPIVYYLESLRVPRSISILLLYFLGAVVLTLFIAYIGPLLTQQIKALANMSVQAYERIKESSQIIASHTFNVDLSNEIGQRMISLLQEATTVISQNILDFLGILTRIAAILAVIPFIVFYLLKDDYQFSSDFLYFFPEEFRDEVSKIVKNVDKTLSNYINGLVIVSFSIGMLLLIGYTLIGLNYALILSLLAVVFMTIPFLGPFLAIIPALLVGLSQSPFMALKVTIVFIIIQQLESNVISPQIIGQRLNIHPLTIILLLLAAGSLYGLVGLLLATPVYAVSKVVLANLYKIYRLHYPH